MQKIIAVCLLLFLSSCAYSPQVKRYSGLENKKAQVRYEMADALKQKGDYARAAVEFRNFVDNFPGSHLEDDAQYNVAECMESADQINEAINEYGITADRFPESDYAPKALQKASELCEKLERWEDAAKIYVTILDRYYFSGIAENAKKRLENILDKHKGSIFASETEARMNKIIKEKEKK